MNYSEEIKNRVTARDMFRFYGFNINRGGFCKSPFSANDNTPSLKVYDGNKGWHDFSSGKGGDVINFVQEYFHLGFLDAVKKINSDMNLGLPLTDDLTEEAKKEAARIAYQRRKEQERKKKLHETLLTAYHSALDEWIRLDSVICKEAPETPFDGFTEAYADAVKRIDFAGYKLDAAEMELYRFERT